MNPIAAQQVALDNALVVPEKRLKIEKCNMRIEFNKPQREPTFQVTLDKIKDKFKLDKKKFQIDTEVFCEILQICPRLPNQDFVKPPSDEEMVLFIKDLGYTGKCDMLSEIYTDQMHQPWRTFVAVINRCISGKSTGLDRLRPSRAQILWGMFYKKNVDFVALLWEDFMFQADNRDISSARKENMPYPRFTKVIINHFISKDKTISMRNKINLHTIRDDSLLGTLKYVSKTEDYQKYGALIPEQMINQAIQDSKEYKIYLSFATEEATPKKARKDTPDVSMSKKKAPATTDRSKGIDLLSEATLLDYAQMKKVLKQSKMKTHSHQASGSGDRVGSQPKVPDELQDKATGTNEGTGTIPDRNDDDSDNDRNDDDGNNDASDDEGTESDDDQKDDDKEDEYEDEYVRTPVNYGSTNDENEHGNE
ncbi:hypothetical protein Tco_0809859, partial [Tanacetum coccineum]